MTMITHGATACSGRYPPALLRAGGATGAECSSARQFPATAAKPAGPIMAICTARVPRPEGDRLGTAPGVGRKRVTVAGVKMITVPATGEVVPRSAGAGDGRTR
jgi:hypothetical protein